MLIFYKIWKTYKKRETMFFLFFIYLYHLSWRFMQIVIERLYAFSFYSFFFVFYSISLMNKININDYNHEKRIEWVRENNASDLKKLFIILSVFISGNIYLCANCNDPKSDLFQFKGKINRCNTWNCIQKKKKKNYTRFVLGVIINHFVI